MIPSINPVVLLRFEYTRCFRESRKGSISVTAPGNAVPKRDKRLGLSERRLPLSRGLYAVGQEVMGEQLAGPIDIFFFAELLTRQTRLSHSSTSAHAPLAISPPSTQTFSPVINDALSLAKNNMALAMSSGWP